MTSIRSNITLCNRNIGYVRESIQNQRYSDAESYLSNARQHADLALSKLNCFSGAGMRTAVSRMQNRLDSLSNQLDNITKSK